MLTALGEPRPRVLLRAAYIRAGYGDVIETRGRLSRPRSRPGLAAGRDPGSASDRWVIGRRRGADGRARSDQPARRAQRRRAASSRRTPARCSRSRTPRSWPGWCSGRGVGLPPELRRGDVHDRHVAPDGGLRRERGDGGRCPDRRGRRARRAAAGEPDRDRRRLALHAAGRGAAVGVACCHDGDVCAGGARARPPVGRHRRAGAGCGAAAGLGSGPGVRSRLSAFGRRRRPA